MRHPSTDLEEKVKRKFVGKQRTAKYRDSEERREDLISRCCKA